MEKWSIQDDLLLYKLQPDYIASDIAKKLGKSKQEVRDRINIIGLRKFDDRAPLQYVVYRVLELHKNTVDNQFIIAGVLDTTIKNVIDHYNREKRTREKTINRGF